LEREDHLAEIGSKAVEGLLRAQTSRDPFLRDVASKTLYRLGEVAEAIRAGN
jgi:hypothetical protein